MISIVMCSRTQAEADRAADIFDAVLAGEQHEVVTVIAAPSMCSGYNAGIRQASGEVVCFVHDDVEPIGQQFAQRLLGHMQRFDVLGVAGGSKLIGPAWHLAGPPHVFGQVTHGDRANGRMWVNTFGVPSRAVDGIVGLDGLFIACRRSVLDRVTFDEQVPGYHLYDIDFSYRAAQAGFNVGVACDLDLLHWGKADFNSPPWQAAAGVFRHKHAATIPLVSEFAAWTIPVAHVASRAEAVEVMRRAYEATESRNA